MEPSFYIVLQSLDYILRQFLEHRLSSWRDENWKKMKRVTYSWKFKETYICVKYDM
jgi:hypothetical protein